MKQGSAQESATDLSEQWLIDEIRRRVAYRAIALQRKIREVSASLSHSERRLFKALELIQAYVSEFNEEAAERGHSRVRYFEWLGQLNDAARVIDEYFLDAGKFDIPRWLDSLAQRESKNLELEHELLLVPGPVGRFQSRTSLRDLFEELVHPTRLNKFIDSEDYFLIGVPRLEGRHAHWIPLSLGHEIAHLKLGDWRIEQSLEALHERVLSNLSKDELAELDLSRISEGSDPDEPSDGSQVLASWIDEVCCDLYSLFRFGPSAISVYGSFFATIEFLDHPTRTHPRGAFRLRCLLRIIDRLTKEVGESESALVAHYLAPWRLLALGQVPDTPLCASTEFLESVIENGLHELWSFWESYAASPAEEWFTDTESGAVDFAPGIHKVVDSLGKQAKPFVGSSDSMASLSHLVTGAWIVTQMRGRTGQQMPAAGLGRHSVEDLLVKSIELVDYRSRRVSIRGYEESPVSSNSRGIEVIPPPPARHVDHDAVDLRLGPRFITFRRTATSSFRAHEDGMKAPEAIGLEEEFGESHEEALGVRQFQVTTERSFGDRFVIHPGEYLLAATLEYLVIPEDVACKLTIRSSYGRLGLTTTSNQFIRGLFKGCLTMELVNFGPVPLRISPGDRICSATFHTTSVTFGRERPSRYMYQIGPTFPRFG